MKMETTNNKYQISNKHQKPINKYSNNLNTFEFWSFKHWNLFVICFLKIEICEV